MFIGHQLTVSSGGVRRITQDILQLWKVFNEVCELPAIMSVPSGDGERVHHAGVHIDADVQFDAVSPASLSCDADLVPGAALMRTESGAIDRDSHLPPAEEPDDQAHHSPDVIDGESGHPAMDDAVPGEHRTIGGEALTVFHVGFDAIVGFV